MESLITLDIEGYEITFYHEGVLLNPLHNIENPRCREAYQLAVILWPIVVNDVYWTLRDKRVRPAKELLDLVPPNLKSKINHLRVAAGGAIATKYLDVIVERFVKEEKKAGFIYVLQSATGYCKIGKTKNPKDRLRLFSVKLPFEVEFAALVMRQDIHDTEKWLHEHFAKQRVNGEWFKLSELDIQLIKDLDETWR